MSKRGYLGGAIGFALALGVVFLMAAFIEGNVSPALWGSADRGNVVIGWLVACPLMVLLGCAAGEAK